MPPGCPKCTKSHRKEFEPVVRVRPKLPDATGAAAGAFAPLLNGACKESGGEVRAWPCDGLLEIAVEKGGCLISSSAQTVQTVTNL